MARFKMIGVTVLVVASVACLLGVSSYVFQPKNNQVEFGMDDASANGILGERKNSLDVLFIGDSEAFSSFSPLQMWAEQGFSSYVSAASGQRLTYGNTLLRRAFRSNLPRLVVFETNSIYAPFTAEDAALRTLQDTVPMFEYHDRWKRLKPHDVAAPVKTTWTDDLKGFRINKGVAAADASQHMAPTDATEDIPALNRQYLQSMIDFCRIHNAVPVLVSTPSTINWNTARHNGIAAFAQQANVDYIDLNAEPTKVDIDWQVDTYDKGDHLNLSGASKTSTYLGALLKERYSLPDHRNDHAYASWDEAFGRYRQIAS